MRRMTMEGVRLRRVVPIAQTQRRGDANLTLLSIELYEDGSVVHFISVSPERRSFQGMMLQEMLTRQPIFRVEDDIGTEYFAFMGGGGGSDTKWHGNFNVTPAVPDAASSMTIYARVPLAMPANLPPQEMIGEVERRLSGTGVGDRTAGPACSFEFALRPADTAG